MQARRCVVTLLAVLVACEPPLPSSQGCSDDTACPDGQRCDLVHTTCVPLDAGHPGDAASLEAGVLDHGAPDSRAGDAASAVDGSQVQDGTLPPDCAGPPDCATSADSATPQDSSAPGDTATTDTAGNADQGSTYFASAGGDQQVARHATVMLSATSSALPPGATIAYAWSLDVAPLGTAAILADSDQVACSFVAGDAHGHYEVLLSIGVDGVPLPVDRVAVDVRNAEPVASAGSDVGTYQDQAVQLDGSGSHDDDGDDLSFAWTVWSGGGSLDDPGSATPIFTPAAGFSGNATLRLTVDDGHGGQDSDEVEVIVSSNLPPQIGALVDVSVPHACSGEPLRCSAQAELGATIVEPEGEAYAVLWELLACPGGDATGGVCPGPGPAPLIVDATATTAHLVLDVAAGTSIAGVYTLRLTATDEGQRAATSTLHVTVGNSAPTGHGGNASQSHSYSGGSYVCQVEFDNEIDDADGDPLDVNYTVSPQAGTVTPGLAGVAIFRVASSTPSAGLLGPYTITVGVDDGQGGSAQLVQVVSCSNGAPAIGTIIDSTPAGHFYRSAGGVYGSNVALSAGVDDAESEPVSCTWSVPAPVASVSYGSMPVVLAPMASFPATAALSREITSSSGIQVIADHGFRLSCSDGFTSTGVDEVVTVTNRYPTANAGTDLSVHHSYSATGDPYRASADLGARGAGNASASDPDGDMLGYTWLQTSSTAGLNRSILNPTTLAPTYSWSGDTRVVATHTLRLTVTDGPGATTQDSMSVVVGNRAPTVNAGADLAVDHAYVGAASRYDANFDLNGRTTKATTSDADGDPLTYAWTATATPAGVTYLYTNQAALNPVITAQGTTSVVGNHDFRLTATDPFAGSASDTLRLTGLNRAPQETVAAVINPAPLVVNQTCWQFDPIGPDVPAHCVAGFGSPAPASAFTATYADPDGDPLTVVATPSVGNNNAVAIAGHGQSGTSITVTSSSGSPIAVNATVSLVGRTFADPCTSFNVTGYFVGVTGKVPGPTLVSVDVTASDPFTGATFDQTTTVSAADKVNCP